MTPEREGVSLPLYVGAPTPAPLLSNSMSLLNRRQINKQNSDANPYLDMCKKNTVGVSMLGRNGVVRLQQLCQTLNEINDFLMPRHIVHRQTTSLRLTTVRHSLIASEHIHTLRFDGHFPGEPGLAGSPLNSPSPLIPELRILLGQT